MLKLSALIYNFCQVYSMVRWVYKVRDLKNNLYLVDLEVHHIKNASFLFHLQVIIVQ
jgi:hypothetical protein